MNFNLLLSGAIAIYGCYVIGTLAVSSATTARFFNISMNKWIVVAIWCAFVYSALTNIYRWYKRQQRSR